MKSCLMSWYCFLQCSLLVFLASFVAAAEPPLPEGLVPAKEEPALPVGLEPAPGKAEPALPAGLEPAPGKAEPALPAGLTSSEGTGEPALPLGLEPDSSKKEPALPAGLDAPVAANPVDPESTARTASPLVLHGFWDMRAGTRVVSDAAQAKDVTLGEMRLQLKTDKSWDRIFFEFTGDSLFDAVDERARLDIRQLRLTWMPMESMDIRIGRQVLTWGTGDMLFINDLFPKDWVSFFSGRDVEYLKAPSNTLRVGWFSDIVNVEVVYTPCFEADRHITGRRFSYYSAMDRRLVGREDALHTQTPSAWFNNDEIALRLYRAVGSAQAALYGYSGYWKSPGGMEIMPARAVFPKLRVYGASLRGPVGAGIASVEMGWYDSYEDRSGTNAFINNSEFRLLLGYEREIAAEFTAGLQYYLEYMLDYRSYRRAQPARMPLRDRDRHVITLRLTKQLMNQNLILSLFLYASPSDKDAYLRPNITYKISDYWTVEGGGNIFLGDSNTSFFGQFQDNTNVYAGIRFSF